MADLIYREVQTTIMERHSIDTIENAHVKNFTVISYQKGADILFLLGVPDKI